MIISDLNYLEAANEVKVVGGRRGSGNKFKLTVKYATIDQEAYNTAVAIGKGAEAEAESTQTATIRQ